MSEQIREIATVTFSGARFEGPGIEPDAFSIVLAYCDLLFQTAKELSKKQIKVRMKFYALENPTGISIRRIVTVDDGCMFSIVGVPDAIDEAAQLIDETLVAIEKRLRVLPEKVTLPLLPMIAALGDKLQQGETITTRAAHSARPGHLTWGVRKRLLTFATDSGNFLPTTTSEDREWILRDAPAAYRKRVRVYDYDDSVPPLWQSVAALGADVPEEVWDKVPADLAENLDHYLYGTTSES